MDEAEVEHLVGLVEDENLDAFQRQGATVDQVDQPARRGDEDVDARRQGPLLAADVHAAEHDGVGVAQMAAVIRERLGDLAGELAGRRQHEHAAAAARGAVRAEREAVQIGRAKAAVLPVPVWAMPHRSRPSMAGGIACAWIGVGVT